MDKKEAQGTPGDTQAAQPKRLSAFIVSLKSLVAGLFSNDSATRRMSALFFSSVLAAVVVLILGGLYYLDRQRARHETSAAEQASRHLNDFFKRQAEEARRKAAQISLGTFSLELKPVPDQKPIRGVLNMAEIEVALECDSKETRETVERNLAQARGQITGIFTAIDRSELMSKEGKNRLRQAIQEKLNSWLPEGRVENVFITRLLVS